MERYSPSTISLSDTTGSADSALTAEIFDVVKTKFPDAPLGVHLHSLPQDVASKAVAAYKAGCRHFEGAINGIGGCPMAADELTGNMDSGLMLTALDEHKAVPQINWAAFEKASKLAGSVFV